MGGLRRFGALAVAFTLVGAGAACGGDDDDEAADETTTTTEESNSSDEDSGDEDSGGEDIGLDTGAVDFGNLDECLQFAGAYASLGLVFLGGAFGGETEDIDVDEIISEVQAVADEAPDDVKDAFETVLETYQEVFDNLEDAGADLNDAFDFTDPDVAEAMEPLNGDDFNEANNEVSAFLDEQCAG